MSVFLVHFFTSSALEFPEYLGVCVPLRYLSNLFFSFVGLTRDCPNSRDLCRNFASWVDKTHYSYLCHLCTTLNLIDLRKLISQPRKKIPNQWFFLFDNPKSTEMNWSGFDSMKSHSHMLICCIFLLMIVDFIIKFTCYFTHKQSENVFRSWQIIVTISFFLSVEIECKPHTWTQFKILIEMYEWLHWNWLEYVQLSVALIAFRGGIISRFVSLIFNAKWMRIN